MKIRSLALLSCTLICLAGTARADDAPPSFATDTFTGDWQGLRSKLYKEGVDVEGSYKVDAWRNFSGGVKTGNALANDIDLQATLNGEKLYGVPGSTIFIYGIGNFGGHPNHEVGSNGGIDNVEVATPTAKLYSAWIEQSFLNDKASVRAGLYDINTEFYVTDASGLFLNSTYGAGTEIAATGQNGPSIFPVTSLGVRLLVKPFQDTYAEAALLDGVPGDPDNAHGTHIQFNAKDGALDIAEVGYKNPDNGHYAVGAWQYTGRFDDYVRTDSVGDPVRRHNYGLYLLMEKTLYQNPSNTDQHFDAFFRIGKANGDVSKYSWSFSTGVLYSNVFTGRKDSQLGLAVSNATNSGKYRSSSLALGSPLDRNETQIELTYSDKLKPWLRIQPDIQYTINPGTDPSAHNSFSAGVRLQFTL